MSGLLAEHGLAGQQVTPTSPVCRGRQMCLSFENGVECSFICVKNYANEQIVRAA